jgi:sterol desaturase/sphingolipid hydroxylase (fatty acid hydroxylase superfamily)
LPTTLFVVSTGDSIAVMTLFLLLQPTFLHSPSSLHFGPLRHVIADNRYHRIHHSVEPRHFDKNFAILFSFWDRLFGTAYHPAPDEWPDVGLAEVDQPGAMKEWLDLPLRLHRGASETPTEPAQASVVGGGESLQPR